MMVGLNCLDPGQQQKTHAHQGADKFISFWKVAEVSLSVMKNKMLTRARGGCAGWNPSWRRKHSEMRLSLLIAIAPPPNQKPDREGGLS